MNNAQKNLSYRYRQRKNKLLAIDWKAKLIK